MILKPLVNLCIEWIIVQQICAVEYLAVGLVKCDHIFFSFEYLDLILIIQLNTSLYAPFPTSSATSGPLLTKPPSLVTETRLLVSAPTVTASSSSVLRKMMYGIQI